MGAAQLDHPVEGRGVATHGVDTVDDDSLPRFAREVIEDPGQTLDIVVRESLHPRVRELDAGEQGVVGVLVEHGEVVAPDEAGDRADVRHVAGGEHERSLVAVELSQLCLQRAVEVEGAVQQPGPRDPSAVLAGGFLGRLDHLGVIREAEVVVRPEVDVLVALDPEAGRRSAFDRLVVGPVAGGLGQAVVVEARERLEAVAKEAHLTVAPRTPLALPALSGLVALPQRSRRKSTVLRPPGAALNVVTGRRRSGREAPRQWGPRGSAGPV